MHMDHSLAMFVLLLMAATIWDRPAHAAGASCIPRERDALLAFMHGINDYDISDNGHLWSWKGSQDCCQWEGITCSNTTGHVLQLDLGERNLVGQISPSLLLLERLEHLDLQATSLYGSNGRIPEFFGSLKNLRYLDLSYMVFCGVVPPQLGNLSKLEYLGLANITCKDAHMQLTDISWLARLPVLSSLDMTRINLGTVGDWPLVVSMMPSLEELYLSGCSLSSASRPLLTHYNVTCLRTLDLSYNYLGSPIASSWFWNATNIEYLDLSNTSMYGPFPNALGNMTSLQMLELSYMGNNATMTVDLKNLCDLEYLDLDESLSSGNITELLEKLPQCRSNTLSTLSLNNNNMVGVLPNRLGQLGSVSWLDLSNNNITGSIPQGIGSCTSLRSLCLNNNFLSGRVPTTIGKLSNLDKLDLSNNKLDGTITEEHLVTLINLRHLDLSHNSFSGSLPSAFGAQGLQELYLSFNYLGGHVPESICQLTNLLVLDLSNNFLEGELPQCSEMARLVFLLLSDNRFSGKFPPSLQNYYGLAFMDLSRNNFSGRLPLWIGELLDMRFLQLSHNLFYGDLPRTITNLKELRQLSLAGNNISGVIPWSLSNFTGMSQANMYEGDFFEWYNVFVGEFRETLPILMKRQELKYGVGIFEVVGIDLSLNHLTGGIPEEIISLNGLLYLNLSWNQLSGKIPAKIGLMKSIESLDLSRNNLTGKIPSSLSDLTYLSSLDFSYNNLIGRIPIGSQLDTLYMENPAMYTGNIGLCGPPLERNCSGDSTPKDGNQQRREKVSDPVWFFYFGLGSGFLAGLWILFCALLFIKEWRITYFRLFDKFYDNAYVFAAVTWGKMNGQATS